MPLTLGETPTPRPETDDETPKAQPPTVHLTLGDPGGPDSLPAPEAEEAPGPGSTVSLTLGDGPAAPETSNAPTPEAPPEAPAPAATPEDAPASAVPPPESAGTPSPNDAPEVRPVPLTAGGVTGKAPSAKPPTATPPDVSAPPAPPQDWQFSVTGFRSSAKSASAVAAPPPVPSPEAAPPAPAPKPAAPKVAPSPTPPPTGGGGNGPSGGGGDGSGSGKPPLRLGDALVEMGLISPDQLHVALLEKRASPKMLGEILVDLGFITEQALAAVLAEASGFERFSPGQTMVDSDLLQRLPKDAALRHRVFPVSVADDGSVKVAMADVYDVVALDQLKRYFGVDSEIKPLVAAENDIIKAIDQYYGHELSIDGILRELEHAGAAAEDVAALDQDGGYTHPIVRLVDAIMLDAVKQKASDVHFEPEGNFLRVRYRIDGEMTQIRTIHKRHWAAFSHRMKLMSGMNIADKLNPQDGRFSMAMGSQRIDFRVSSLPTVSGENLVLRILDKSSAQVPLEALGFTAENFALLTRLVRRPEGIIIVTGPTGSGKTTTLYSVMTYINSLQLNIMTLEDPVEYELSLIRQSQVREGTGMSFAEGIRTLLRQDPDVILVGEVRDSDTATMALRAAMTGHQVYTTLHTNDAAGAIPRLIDMGMRPSLMAGNIIGIMAQRLGRKLCPECKRDHVATEEECRILGVDPASPPTIYEPVGCEACRGTGHKGRIAISEILPFNDTIDEMIIGDAPLSHIKREAANHGFVPMVDDGVRKVLEGKISIQSLVKVVDVTDRLA